MMEGFIQKTSATAFMDGRLMWKFTSGLDFQNHSKTDRGSRCARIAEEIFAKTYATPN